MTGAPVAIPPTPGARFRPRVFAPGALLALQRSGGNRAATLAVSRQRDGGAGDGGVATDPQPGGVTDFVTLLTENRWDEAVRRLGAMSDAAMTEQLRRIRRVDLERLRDQAGSGTPEMVRVRTAAEAARVRQLGLDWDEAVAAGRWTEAVTLVQAYNDVDLPQKLKALTFDQIADLCSAADSMLPAYQRVRTAAEPIRVAKLNEAYEAAVNGSQWARAVLLVNAYNDTDLLPKCRMIQANGPAAVSAAQGAAGAQWPDDNHRVRRTLSFLGVEALTGPAVRTAVAPPVTAGTSEPATAVPKTGGTSTFSSGNTFGTHSNVYGLSYQGPDAPRTGWIQFITRNIELFDAAGKRLRYHTGSWTPSGQSARNFSTVEAPVWFLDTLSNQAPFYEAASTGTGNRGLSTVSPLQTTMYDAPAGRVDLVAPLFADPAVKKAMSRATFDTYLVQEMQVLRHETITVEYSFTPAQAASGVDPTPTTTHTGGGAVSSMPVDRFRAMTNRFPAFAYLPHG
ncbi:MAG TPA: hypothetical protein VFJ85_03665 [Acidimicrobiales bacterium]|nr:hypothetical protein [Acidimicrobiales bacterium]